eukprot:Gb_26272 [translate_table: standard]
MMEYLGSAEFPNHGTNWFHTDKGGTTSGATTPTVLDRARSGLNIEYCISSKGALQKKMEVLRSLRRLLSRTAVPPVEVAVHAGVVPVLVECLSFGSLDEQLLEAAWCLTNIATGELEQTRALLPALPLLIAHLGAYNSYAFLQDTLSSLTLYSCIIFHLVHDRLEGNMIVIAVSRIIEHGKISMMILRDNDTGNLNDGISSLHDDATNLNNDVSSLTTQQTKPLLTSA